MKLPPLTLIRQNDTHRLIPCKYTIYFESVLTKIADNDRHLQDLFDLDHATNDRFWAENDHMPGISSHELVFGVPYCGVVNASFTHANPLGSRFNGPDRGAWYAGFELETSQAEVVFHKTQEYAEVNRFDDSVSYDDFLADFGGEFHDLRSATGFRSCLDPDSYIASQHLADELLMAGSLGIVYPSVRRSSGTCLGCFRPAAVANVRKNYRYCFTWSGTPDPKITCSSIAGQ
jgi:hypothetical protein